MASKRTFTQNIPPTKQILKINNSSWRKFKLLVLIKPGSHDSISISLVHTSRRHKHKQRKQRMNSPLRLAKTKQREFFFVSPFVLLFAYAWTMILYLCLWRSLCRRLDLIPLFCLLFCPYAYAYAIVWTRLIVWFTRCLFKCMFYYAVNYAQLPCNFQVNS